MKHLLTGRVRIILIVAVLLAASLAILSNALGMNLPTMLTNAVLAPIRYGATALTEQADGAYLYLHGSEEFRRIDTDGSMVHIGAGCSLPLHNTAFLPDEQAPVVAAAVHAAVIQKFLMDA